MRAWLRSHLVPGRHTTYFEVLDALQEESCPICRLALRSVARYLDMLSYEAVNDPGVRSQLRAARGFCNYHTWQFTHEVRNGAGRAMIYHDVLGVPMRSLSAPSVAGLARNLAAGNRPHPDAGCDGADLLADRLLPTGECPACGSLARATRRYLETLLLHLSGGEMRQRYQVSHGLCLPHLRMALRQVKRGAEVELLLGVAARWAAGLRVVSRYGLRSHTLAIVDGVMGKPGAILPTPLSQTALAKGLEAIAALSPDDLEAPLSRAQGCPVCDAAVAAGDACLAFLPTTVRAQGPDTDPAPALDLCGLHAWRSLDLLPPGAAARLWQPAARSIRQALAAEAAEPTIAEDGQGLLSLLLMTSADVINSCAWPAGIPHLAASLLRPSGVTPPASHAGLGERGALGPGATAAARLEPPHPCPACCAQAAVEQQTARMLLAASGAKEPGSRWDPSLRFCLPHFALGLRLSASGRERHLLLSDQQATLKGLRADLAEYIRKQNFRCREGRGQEADSPWRVVAQIAGADGLPAGPLLWTRRPAKSD